jgi:maltooligosyltrehalose trehalohydrolase
MRHLVKAFREGFVYSGEYSQFRRRRHGTSSRDISAERFTVFSQNHDQVGNRAKNDRLARMVSFDALKLAAGSVLLSPFVPLLFMGEEYGETAPFPFFTDHSEPGLIEAVRRGRREEFAAFKWDIEIPDPQDPVTFLSAKPDRSLQEKEPNAALLAYYGELIRLRKQIPALSTLTKDGLEVNGLENEKILCIRRRSGNSEAIIISSFNDSPVAAGLVFPPGKWDRTVDSADDRWKGPGSGMPRSIRSEGGEFTLNFSPWQLILYLKEV